MEKVCILLATYNGENYLKQQINSILNQTYSNIIVLISDDASTDNTKAIIEEFVAMYPRKIIFLGSEKKGGAVNNFAYLYKNAISADYYMFSDQDDVWDNNKIEKSVKKLVEMKSAGKINCLVYCDARLVDDTLQVIAQSFLKNSHYKMNDDNRANILVSSFAPGAAMIFDRSLYAIVKEIPNEAHIHDWWLLLHAVYLGNVGFIDEQLYSYRQHTDNVYGAGLIRNKNGLINYFKNNSVLSTLNRLNKQTNELQLKQLKMINKFYINQKDNISEHSKRIILDYFNMFADINMMRKLQIIIKNKFHSISLLDTMLYTLNILRRKV